MADGAAKRRRVYSDVTVAAVAGGHQVVIDGRALQTPARKPVMTSHVRLAEAIAAEWDAQGEHIDPVSMPMTRLLNTALDKVEPAREAVIGGLMGYADSDLLCYWADGPASLVERQAALWRPVLDWLETGCGIRYELAAGVMPLSQPAGVKEKLKTALAEADDYRLTVIQTGASLTGSLALALALARARLSAAETVAAAELDETHQMETWGEDSEALKRRERLDRDVAAVERFRDLLEPV